jgi:hypothetical protein
VALVAPKLFQTEKDDDAVLPILPTVIRYGRLLKEIFLVP